MAFAGFFHGRLLDEGNLLAPSFNQNMMNFFDKVNGYFFSRSCR